MGSVYESSREDLAAVLDGEPRYRLDQVWTGLWREARSVTEITTVPLALRRRLAAAFPPALEVAHDVTSDRGATRKWVFRLHDGARGEPLAHYAVTVEVVRRLHELRGLGARHLTVSTVGVAPAISRLAREGLPLTLAVSLHAANDEDRDRLIPLNRRYPLARLAEACRDWIDVTGRRISFEWALIEGVNDTDRALEELANYARDLGAHVNLIPLNPTPGFLVRGSTRERVSEFRDGLDQLGVNATVRNTRGRSIDAACGQLAAVTNGRRRSLQVRPR